MNDEDKRVLLMMFEAVTEGIRSILELPINGVNGTLAGHSYRDYLVGFRRTPEFQAWCPPADAGPCREGER